MRQTYLHEIPRRDPESLAEYHECGRNNIGSYAYCLMHEAIISHRQDLVKAILANRKCPNGFVLRNGYSSIHRAILEKQTEILQILVQAGQNLNIRDQFGNSPVLVAAGQSNFDLFGILVENGANYYVPNNFGTTVVHRISQYGTLEMMKFIFERDVYFKESQINLTNCGGVIPLHYAAMFGRNDLVEYLAVNGANRNYRDHFGRTPLDWAETWSQIEVIRILNL